MTGPRMTAAVTLEAVTKVYGGGESTVKGEITVYPRNPPSLRTRRTGSRIVLEGKELGRGVR
jgi:hypothetical protein